MSGMFGKPATDQSYKNAVVGNTIVTDKLIARSVNFRNSNYIYNLNPNKVVEEISFDYEVKDGTFSIAIPKNMLILKCLVTSDSKNYNDDSTETFDCYVTDNLTNITFLIENGEVKSIYRGGCCVSGIKDLNAGFGSHGCSWHPICCKQGDFLNINCSRDIKGNIYCKYLETNDNCGA
jgi:hypothetical protein